MSLYPTLLGYPLRYPLRFYKRRSDHRLGYDHLVSPSPEQWTANLREIQPRKTFFSRAQNSLLLPSGKLWRITDQLRHPVPHMNYPCHLKQSTSRSSPRLPPLPRKHVSKGRTDLYKLHIAYGLNPISGALSKSSKCVLSSDWRLAQQELRHIRAMERIEAKKNEGRWSLRQPKKLKGPMIPKAHWDYLLDEMVGFLHSACLTSGMDADRLRRRATLEDRGGS